jgi:hypothetical protein
MPAALGFFFDPISWLLLAVGIFGLHVAPKSRHLPQTQAQPKTIKSADAEHQTVHKLMKRS